MSVIAENNRLYFWYDTHKPRREEGRAEAIARWAHSKGLQRERLQKFHSIHHIDGDRSNGASYNLFVCETQQQHNNLHLQLQEAMTRMIKFGLVKFDWLKKKYYIDDPYVTSLIK